MSTPKMKSNPATVSVLWMDDEPQPTVTNYKEILIDESKTSVNKVNINIVNTIEEAEAELATDKYGALVVDFRMNPDDPSVNGAEFLKETNEKRKYFPTFVYSGWVDDPNYKWLLEESYAVAVVRKPGKFVLPLMEQPFFRKIYQMGERYQRLKRLKPERIKFQDFIKQPDYYRPDVNIHWEKHGHWITTELKRKGYLWGVVCGERVIDGSSNLFDYPNEKSLWEYGKSHNLIPFAYSVPFLPEDAMPRRSGGSSWSSTEYPDDYYPSFRIIIDDKELIDDFDTGAYQTVVSEQLVKRGLLDFIRGYEPEFHLDSGYEYLTKKVKISVIDHNGNSQTRELPVVVVKEWETSPFIKINKDRKILIGRDILRAFQLEVCLDSVNRITRINFISEESEKKTD